MKMLAHRGAIILLLLLFSRIATLADCANPSEPVFLGYSVVTTLDNLTFQRPLCIASPPGETNRLFVLEKGGNVVVVSNLVAPTRTIFMSVTGNVTTAGEKGLLGMAFHPDYANNRLFYLFYTFTNPLGQTFDNVSQFEADPADANHGLLESEVHLITQFDRSDNHQGGDIHFGPDGYLYISLGDEGGGSDQFGNSQIITKNFFSGILRIDVDKKPGNLAPNPHSASSANYLVPFDNPFVGATNFNGKLIDPDQVRTEFWAVGLRNPWRMSFDAATGNLFVGDVGQEAREEVDLVSKGGNYGWNYREGNVVGPNPGAPSGFHGLNPIASYLRTGTNGGTCVIGGVVYRGQKLSQLIGSYIFADFLSGNVWSLVPNGTNAVPFNRIAFEIGIVAFGTDPRDGEILLANFMGNNIKKLVAKPDQPPVIKTVSVSNSSRIINGPALTVTGTARDDSHVCQVFYQHEDGEFQLANGTTNWNFTVVMHAGTNHLSIKCVDDGGHESAPMNVAPFYVVTNGLVVNIAGSGSVTPNLAGHVLEIGKWYRMKAVPGANYVFTNWSGGVSSSNPILDFQMESNLVLQANFILSPFLPLRGNYYGLFLPNDPIGLQNAGFLSLNLADRGGFTGSVKIDGAVHSLKGNFLLDGTAISSVPRIGKTTINLSLALNLATPDDMLTGHLGDGSWSADLKANRSVYSFANPAKDWAGKYTMVFPPDADGPSELEGDGYATATVSSNGTTMFTGALADNSLISPSIPVSKNGEWPFYAPLYYGYTVLNNGTRLVTNREYQGVLIGWLTITNSEKTLGGSLHWIKKTWTNDFLPEGYTNGIAAVGSEFQTPGRGIRVVNFTNFSATFSGGNLDSTLTQTLSLTTNNMLTFAGPNSIALKLQLNVASGSFSGSFRGTDSKTNNFKGALLQTQNFGAGFFFTNNTSGSVLLQALP